MRLGAYEPHLTGSSASLSCLVLGRQSALWLEAHGEVGLSRASVGCGWEGWGEAAAC